MKLAAIALATVFLGTAPPALDEVGDYVRSQLAEQRIPGLALAIVRNGQIVKAEGYGIADVDNDVPVTPDTVFEVASITKQFTATLIMMLVEEQKLRLDDKLVSFLTDPPAAWQTITIYHLLTHTAGLAPLGDDFKTAIWRTSMSTAALYEASKRDPMGGAPGERWSYSDVGYFLLGMVIEKASGTTYRDFMQRRVFAPLGMTRTSLTDRRRVIPGRVATYEIADGQLVNWRRDWDYELPSFFGIWSTLDDVARWDTALRRRTLLSQASLDAMWTPATLSDGRDALVDGRLYGFGFRLGEIRGHRAVSHTGASGTLLLHLRDEPLTVIVLTNLSNTAGRHGTTLGHGIVGLLRPALAPVQTLAPRADPAPERTRALQALLADLAEGRESPAMTAAHAAYFRALPPIARDPLRTALAGAEPLAFVACDEVAGKGIRITDPIERICHYRGTAGGRPTWFTFWLTRDGKAAHLRLAGPDDY